MIKPIAKILVPKNKCQFRLLDDRDSDNWNDYIMRGEKVTFYDDKLLFRDTGVVFTLKGDILSLITEYDVFKTCSPDAKQFIIFLAEMHFGIHAKRKSSRDRNLKKTNLIKKAILSSGLRTLHLSENADVLCDR